MITKSDKWQSMLTIVNQYSQLLPSNTRTNQAQQFKKLVRKRLLAENILVFLLQYIGLKLSTLTLHPSPLWLATGTACAYLFLRGYSVLPGVWLGSFLGFYLEKIGFLLALDCATVLTLQGFLLLWFSYRYLSPTLIFNHLPMFIKFIVYTALLTALASFMLIFICYSSLLSHKDTLFQHWLQWWLANFNAILIFSCALLTWDAYFADFYAVKQWKSIAMLFGLLLFFIIGLIFSHTPASTTFMALSILLITVFISAKFGWCGAITAAFLSGILLCFAGFFDAVLFSTYSTAVTLLLLQLFLCLNTIIALSVAIKRNHSLFNG